MPVIKLANDAHIYERITCDHRLTGYQVKIHRVSYPPSTKTFDDLKEARIAVIRVLAEQWRGLRITPLLAERSTLADVKGKTAELRRLRGFLKPEQALCAARRFPAHATPGSPPSGGLRTPPDSRPSG